jgi:predicted phage terminase large subunit-like protein
MSWDLNVKDQAKSDFTVGQVWGCRLAQRFLLDQVRARMGFTGALQAVKDLRAKWPNANAILIEDKANGPAVIDSLRNEIPGVIAIEPRGSKQQRAAAVTPLWQAGNIWLPRPEYAPWIADFVEEHAGFPSARHDDQVDAETQALEYLRWNVAAHTDFRPAQGPPRASRDLISFSRMGR